MKIFLERLKGSARKIFEKYFSRDKTQKLPIFYINGSQTLPPPLSSLEEEKLLEKLKNNDQEAKQILVERNLRLVVYISKKFENTGLELEDLISIGTIGLMKAINTFNSDKNIKLATYASRCIENEILMQLRRTTKIKTEVSIDEPLNKDGDGNELLLSDILGTDGDITSKGLEDEVDKKLLKIAISKLTPREMYIMQLRFGIGSEIEKEKTQKEVADMLGISQSYISRLEKKIMKKMKKEITSKTG
jgi:RNA polymerase sporulation-specific sigma factor